MLKCAACLWLHGCTRAKNRMDLELFEFGRKLFESLLEEQRREGKLPSPPCASSRSPSVKKDLSPRFHTEFEYNRIVLLLATLIFLGLIRWVWIIPGASKRLQMLRASRQHIMPWRVGALKIRQAPIAIFHFYMQDRALQWMWARLHSSLIMRGIN